jgi:hypothetical protein
LLNYEHLFHLLIPKEKADLNPQKYHLWNLSRENQLFVGEIAVEIFDRFEIRMEISSLLSIQSKKKFFAKQCIEHGI